MEPKSKKKAMQESIEKVMHLGIAFWKDFGGFFNGKMEACWHQHHVKIDPNFEQRFFENTLFFLRKNNDFEGPGDRSWR